MENKALFTLLAAIVGAFALTMALPILKSWHRRIRAARCRQKIARTLRSSMEGLTLNSVGPIYGVKRQPGENNRSYKRRILRAARTADTVNVPLNPAAARTPNTKGGPAHGLQNRGRTKSNS